MRLIRLSPTAGCEWVQIPMPRADLVAGLSLKTAGDMRIGGQRREMLFRRMGIDPSRVRAFPQLHSRRIVRVGPGEPASGGGADGLITDCLQSVLSVTVGDCLPIFLVHRRGRAFALLHSGWRGTGIVRDAVRLMESEYAAAPQELAAVLGPCIGACCYAVERERYEEFRSRFGLRAVRIFEGRFFLDLKEANIGLLAGCGVEEVISCAECTACTPWLASYRRDGPNFVRMLAFIGGTEG